MADEESKKTTEKNAKEESEKEKKSASRDAETDSEQTSESQDDTATKHKTGQKSKKDEEEESSDDEELVGSLDAPLVIEGKRARKSTEFLSHNITSPITNERKKIVVPEGKGDPLGSMPRVQFQLNKIVWDELKPLHKLLYGRPGTAMEVKKNIRLFKGFDLEKGSKEYKKKEEQVDRFTPTSIKRLCDILDVDKRGSQEEVFERLMDFLLCPKASGKDVPEPKKKGQVKKKKTTQKKETTKKKETSSSSKGKTTNSKSKKVKSNETVVEEEESEKEDDVESEETDKKSPTKKKTPSKKSQPKKPPKKDKKVVSIKISPGNKAKNNKGKRQRNDDDSEDEPLIKKKKKTPPTDDEIVELVKELLEDADLEKVTMKSVCKQVYDRFPDFDLTDRKEFIKDSVKEIIT